MALALVLTLGFLTPWRADGQRSPHLGTVTAEGRVTYYANGAVSTTDWIVGISARQHLHDGRWDSFALDVVWDAGSWRGGALGTRVFGRYDRLKDHSRAFPGVEVWWRASRRVTVTGAWVGNVDFGGSGRTSLGLQSAGVGGRARLASTVALSALLRYEATRRALKADLAVRVLP
jgi:hypothetical protein